MPDYLDEDKYRYRQPPSFKGPAAAVAVLVTASALHHYWNAPENERQFLSDLHANEMFCRSPEYEGDVFFDPFILASQTQAASTYGQFWSETTDQKIMHFSFDYNSTTTNDDAAFFSTIPQEVIDDPDVTFILSGHATYDLDDQLGLRSGITPPRDFEKLHVRHLRNNFEIVNGRLDYIKGRLMEAGISEDRIVLQNLNTRFDKRAVDLEVCMPPGNEV